MSTPRAIEPGIPGQLDSRTRGPRYVGVGHASASQEPSDRTGSPGMRRIFDITPPITARSPSGPATRRRGARSCSTSREATASRCPRCTRRSTSGPTPTGPTTSAAGAAGSRHARSRTSWGPARSSASASRAARGSARATWPSRSPSRGCCWRRAPIPTRPVPRRLRRARARAGRSPARAGRPAGRHRHAQRRPVRLEGPAGSPPLPRPRHGHPRGPGPRRTSRRAATS